MAQSGGGEPTRPTDSGQPEPVAQPPESPPPPPHPQPPYPGSAPQPYPAPPPYPQPYPAPPPYPQAPAAPGYGSSSTQQPPEYQHGPWDGAGRQGSEGEGPILDRPQAPPRNRRDAGLWLIFAVLGFAAGEITATIAALIAANVAGKSSQLSTLASQPVPPEWYVVSSLVGLWVGFFGAPWLACRVRGSRNLVRDLGIRFKPIDLVGIAIGVGGQVVVTALYAPFIHDLKNFNAPTQRLTGAAHGWGFVVIAVFTVIGAPFFEELFFRGLLFRGLVRFFAPTGLGQGTARAVAVVAAVIVDGILFGLAHGEWEQLAGLALFGMALAAVSYRTGRLGMNMVAHASFNLVAILALASTNGVVFH